MTDATEAWQQLQRSLIRERRARNRRRRQSLGLHPTTRVGAFKLRASVGPLSGSKIKMQRRMAAATSDPDEQMRRKYSILQRLADNIHALAPARPTDEDSSSSEEAEDAASGDDEDDDDGGDAMQEDVDENDNDDAADDAASSDSDRESTHSASPPVEHPPWKRLKKYSDDPASSSASPSTAPFSSPSAAKHAPFFFSTNSSVPPTTPAPTAPAPASTSPPAASKHVTASAASTPVTVKGAGIAAPLSSRAPASGAIIVGREAFDPRALDATYNNTLFGSAQVGDWDTHSHAESALKRQQKLTQDKLMHAASRSAPSSAQRKPKSAWDAELDAGHVRKVKNKDKSALDGTASVGANSNLFQQLQSKKDQQKQQGGDGGADGAHTPKRGMPQRVLEQKGYSSHKERNEQKKKRRKVDGQNGDDDHGGRDDEDGGFGGHQKKKKHKPPRGLRDF